MSVHRFKTTTVDSNRITALLPVGAVFSVTGAEIFVDVDLTDDANLADLTEAMLAVGYVFVETTPATKAPLGLRSPDDTEWQINIDNAGALTTS